MDEDQEICRVCRSESTPNHPLYHPCKCSGSIRFVHDDCLIEWLSHSKKKYCELCEHPFEFSPIYRPDMPEHVPVLVLFSQLIRRLATFLQLCLRGLLVLCVWLVVLPNFTLRMWRFYFWSGENIGFSQTTNETIVPEEIAPSVEQDNSQWTPFIKHFLYDCLEGQIITAFVIVIFVAGYVFREWVMQNLPIADQQLPEENNNEQLEQDQLALETLQNAMQTLYPEGGDEQFNEEAILRISHQLEELRVGMENERIEKNRAESSTSQENGYNNNNNNNASTSSPLQHHHHDMTSDDHYHNHFSDNESEQAGPDRYNNHVTSHDDENNEETDEEMPFLSNPFEHLGPNRLDQHRPDLENIRWGYDNIDDHRENEDTHRWEFTHNEHRFNHLDMDDLRPAERQPEPEIPAPAPQQQAPVNPPAPQNQVDDEEPFDVADDINGVLEAIGMRGNLWLLFQNSILMALMISMCLSVAVWIPYVIGRVVIMIRPASIIEVPIYTMRLITDPLVDFVLDLCIPYIWSIIGEPVKSFIPENIQLALNSIQQQFSQGVETLTETAVSNHTQVVSEATTSFSNNGTSHLAQLDWNLLQAKFESWGTVALARWHQFAAGQTGLDRSMCILVGYIVLIYIGSWYLSLGRRRSTASTEFVQDIIRQQGIFLKVFFFIVIELVIFPTTCGFLLDLATLPLFVNASFASRYVFHLKSPYASYFLHWFLGTGILFYFAIFITVCREIIRPGVMWFLRDPSDPQFNPVQEMVQKPFGSLMRKISQSALIYSIMLVFGVGTVTYTLSLTGIVFPLRLPLDVPLSTLSIDLLIIQFLLPPLIALVKPRDYSKKALDLWWHFACRQLRLTSFMFNQRMPDEEGEHVRRTLKAWLCMKKAPIPEGVFEEVGIDLDQDEDSSVVFRRNGAMMRVPKLDSVPVDPTRPMLIPVDPVSLEPLIEEERGRKHPAAADTNDEAQSTIIVYVPPHFKHRIIVFLLFMWFSISMGVCSVTVVPLLLGRLLFAFYLAPQSKVNDLYSFGLGLYIMVIMGTVAHKITTLYVSYRENEYKLDKDEAMQFLKENTKKAAKFLYLASTLGLIIPLLFGIAVDLFVSMPIRNISDSTSGLVINVSQDWSFGVAYISILFNIIHVVPALNRFQRQLNEIMGDNIMQADISVITRKVIVPMILITLLAISVPAIISWCVLQFSDSPDPSQKIIVIRHTYPAVFCLAVLVLGCLVFRKLLHLWLQTIRDDAYLIGKRLHNMENESDEATTSSAQTSSG